MHLDTVLCLCILWKPNGACPVCVLHAAGVPKAGGAFGVLLCDFYAMSLGVLVESVFLDLKGSLSLGSSTAFFKLPTIR